ncbi:MAG: LuxR C-terminal-related transcriptional regulator, partial [Saprospiraceae bacterium]|nr:LuxR C-terminal-related transcriptional regulator [Saprospiraceae bacterium]
LIKELRQIVRTSLALDDETETNYFTLYRNQKFVDRLLKAHSNLTEGEIRLSNYLRLGLSSKEIANLLFMNPDSVKVARSRLRKKLGLTERSTSLSGYLQKFISPVD